MKYLIPGGGTAVFLLLLIVIFFFVCVGSAAAQEQPSPPTESFLETVFVSGGVGTWPSILMFVAIVSATWAGMLDAKRPHPWLLWPRLVRGLGEAGFLLALITTFGGMREAMQVVARVGAAITPADISFGLAGVLAKLVLGAGVALTGLAAAALLRWWRHRLLPRIVGRVEDEFA